jgi:hypothetical protein
VTRILQSMNHVIHSIVTSRLETQVKSRPFRRSSSVSYPSNERDDFSFARIVLCFGRKHSGYLVLSPETLRFSYSVHSCAKNLPIHLTRRVLPLKVLEFKEG